MRCLRAKSTGTVPHVCHGAVRPLRSNSAALGPAVFSKLRWFVVRLEALHVSGARLPPGSLVTNPLRPCGRNLAVAHSTYSRSETTRS